jgi:parvulin-like peptidyl-prolyl isomerase
MGRPIALTPFAGRSILSGSPDGGSGADAVCARETTLNKRIGQWSLLVAALCGIAGGCSSQPAESAGRSNTPAPNASTPSSSLIDARNLPDSNGPAAGPADIIGPAVPVDVPVARLDDRVITREQLLRPLIEAHGLNFLLGLVQLEAAKVVARSQNVSVTPDEIKAERQITLSKLFRESDEKYDESIDQARRAKLPHLVDKLEKQKAADREMLLKQFLEQQRVSPGELDVVLETNAYLRKIVEPRVRAGITDDMLRKEFEVKYNERVKVRHILVDKLADYGEAVRRIKDKGERFETVAQQMSRNPQTGVLGGELPPFSREDTRFPQAFRDAAFALKPGELSPPVGVGEGFHLIQMIERVPPRGLPFDQVKESLRRELIDTTVVRVMGEQRELNAEYARKALKIEDPLLAQQFQAKIDEFKKVQEDAAARAQLELDRERLRSGSTTQPATRPAGEGAAPVVRPTSGPAVGPAPVFTVQPPAVTQPAAAATSAAATKPVGAATRPAGSPN